MGGVSGVGGIGGIGGIHGVGGIEGVGGGVGGVGGVLCGVGNRRYRGVISGEFEAPLALRLSGYRIDLLPCPRIFFVEGRMRLSRIFEVREEERGRRPCVRGSEAFLNQESIRTRPTFNDGIFELPVSKGGIERECAGRQRGTPRKGVAGPTTPEFRRVQTTRRPAE